MITIIGKARKLVTEKKVDEAVRLLKERIEVAGDNREEFLMELGIIYNGIADFPQALNYFNEVLRLNPDNSRAHTYVDMINGILNYYCKDLLNP